LNTSSSFYLGANFFPSDSFFSYSQSHSGGRGRGDVENITFGKKCITGLSTEKKKVERYFDHTLNHTHSSLMNNVFGHFKDIYFFTAFLRAKATSRLEELQINIAPARITH